MPALEKNAAMPFLAKQGVGGECLAVDRKNGTASRTEIIKHILIRTASFLSTPHQLLVSRYDGILSPSFREIFLTETVKYWARDTIQINWKTLIRLMTNLKAAATRSRAEKRKKKHVETVFSQQAESGQSSAATGPSHTAIVQSSIEGLDQQGLLPRSHVATVISPPPALPNHVVLFKATAAVETEEWIDEDGQVVLTGLKTFAGGDFNFVNPAQYWTPERATAEEYLGYAQSRCKYSEVWLIQIQIKESFVDALKNEDLWYSRDWKEYVWYCRRKREPPARYDGLWKAGTADVIRGHICKNDAHVITNIKKQEVQDQMNENNLMRNQDGSKATQWCFVQYESISSLAQEIKGKIHVEVAPPLYTYANEESK